MRNGMVILGAGLSGLSAAYHLKGGCEVFEKKSEIGGLCRSIYLNGFTFDYGPHILYTVNPYASRLIKRLLKGNFLSRQREAWIFHKKYSCYTRFPFQSHLYGLPKNLVKSCIMGLFEARMLDGKTPAAKNYHEWMNRIFGKGITDSLMVPYAEKLWTVPPSAMNYDWIERRVPQPDIETILEGALGNLDKRVGFNNDFWYPEKDGISALPHALAKRPQQLHLNKEVMEIDLKNKEMTIKTGERVRYDRMISSLPLPLMVELTRDAPRRIVEAANDLKHNSILCVNLGVRRPEISDKHWIYYYEKEFCFHRISFQMNFSPYTVPRGMSSISTEVAYSQYKRISKKNIIDRVINDLIKAGILRKDDEIMVSDVRDIKYAYIIYDHNHRKNVRTIHHYFNNRDIYPCGRFGEWEYYNMDHSILSGRRVALKLAEKKTK
ncbi:MAG: protoporphyrinogen/coproporphyrinogen oxidase [Planctomycetota bacterium]|jgi:UDP-galactopyranose mutase